MPVPTPPTPPDEPRVRTVFYAPRSLVAELRVLGAANDRKLSAEIRLACREHLARAREAGP